MAHIDPEWMLWAKAQKDKTESLIEQVHGQSLLLQKVPVLEQKVGELSKQQERLQQLQSQDRQSTKQALDDTAAQLRNNIDKIALSVSGLEKENEILAKELKRCGAKRVATTTETHRVRSCIAVYADQAAQAQAEHHRQAERLFSGPGNNGDLPALLHGEEQSLSDCQPENKRIRLTTQPLGEIVYTRRWLLGGLLIKLTESYHPSRASTTESPPANQRQPGSPTVSGGDSSSK